MGWMWSIKKSSAPFPGKPWSQRSICDHDILKPQWESCMETPIAVEKEGSTHPRALQELAAVLTEPPSLTAQQSWLRGEVPVDWRPATVTPFNKKGWKDDQGTTALSA